MPNPLSTESQYIFLRHSIYYSKQEDSEQYRFTGSQNIKRFSSKSYAYLGILCLEALVCMSFIEIQRYFSWQGGIFLL